MSIRNDYKLLIFGILSILILSFLRERENKQITAKWSETTNQLKLTRENKKNNYDVSMWYQYKCAIIKKLFSILQAGGGDMKQQIGTIFFFNQFNSNSTLHYSSPHLLLI